MYVDSVLVGGERVLHRGYISMWTLSSKLLFGILFVPGATIAMVMGNNSAWSSSSKIMLDVVLAPLLVAGVVALVSAWLRYRSTELAVTNRRVIAKFGVVQRRTTEVNLDKIESLQVEQSMCGRVLGFGTLLIRGTGSSLEPIPGIGQPMDFRRAVMEAVDAMKPAARI